MRLASNTTFSHLPPAALAAPLALVLTSWTAPAPADTSPEPTSALPAAVLLDAPGEAINQSNARTVATGLVVMQEPGLESLYGLDDDSVAWVKPMLGIFDANVVLDTNVADIAHLDDYREATWSAGDAVRGGVVTVGVSSGLAVHYVSEDMPGVILKDVISGSEIFAQHVATGDANGDGIQDFVVGDGLQVKLRSGAAPYAGLGSYTAPSGPLEIFTLEWLANGREQVFVQYHNGYEILDWQGSSFQVIASRFGATLDSFYAAIETPGPKDRLVWLLDHPSLGWIILTLKHQLGQPGNVKASPFASLPNAGSVTSISAGDGNGDGHADLVLSRAGLDAPCLLVNQAYSDLSSPLFSTASGFDFDLDLGKSLVTDQSPIAIGDLDENGAADFGMVSRDSKNKQVTHVWDGIETAIQDLDGIPANSPFTGQTFEYDYASGEDAFYDASEVGFGVTDNNNIRLAVNTDAVAFGTTDLQVAMFVQVARDVPVSKTAWAFQKRMETVSGLSNVYQFSAEQVETDDPRTNLDSPGKWTGGNSGKYVYIALRPFVPLETPAPIMIIGYWPGGNATPAEWTQSNEFGIVDPALPNWSAPAGQAPQWATSGPPQGPPVGCPPQSGPAAPRGIVDTAIPIKRLRFPPAQTPTFGPPLCIHAIF